MTDSEDGETTSYSRGVPVGYVDKDKDKIYVYNHVQLIVKYHETQNGARVVGIYAEPYSVRHKFAAGVQVPSASQESKNAALNSDSVKTCTGYPMTRTDANFAGPQELIPGGQIIYTYDVVWEPSDVAWASRWDIYLNTHDETLNNVHWFSIVNAVIIVLTLGAILAVILVRSLRADLSRYNEERQSLVGGPLLRLHGARRARRRARGGRGGLPRVAQVPRVHLRADQVRLVGRLAARVPLLPVPPPCKRCPLPRQRRRL